MNKILQLTSDMLTVMDLKGMATGVNDRAGEMHKYS